MIRKGRVELKKQSRRARQRAQVEQAAIAALVRERIRAAEQRRLLTLEARAIAAEFGLPGRYIGGYVRAYALSPDQRRARAAAHGLKSAALRTPEQRAAAARAAATARWQRKKKRRQVLTTARDAD